MPNEPLASLPPIAISTAGVMEQRHVGYFGLGKRPSEDSASVPCDECGHIIELRKNIQ